MNIESGKTYVTRSGERITVMDLAGHNKDYPIVGLDDRKRLHKFTTDGHYVNKSFPHPKDLVGEV